MVYLAFMLTDLQGMVTSCYGATRALCELGGHCIGMAQTPCCAPMARAQQGTSRTSFMFISYLALKNPLFQSMIVYLCPARFRESPIAIDGAVAASRRVFRQ